MSSERNTTETASQYTWSDPVHPLLPAAGPADGTPVRMLLGVREGAAGSAGRTESTSDASNRHGSGLFLGLSSGPQASEGDAMSDSLPERPNLDQLRRQAKELRDDGRRGDANALERLARHHRTNYQGPVSLAAAQLVIARELGYSSWPQLRVAVDAAARSDIRDDAFVTAAVDGRLKEAVTLYAADPGVARRSLRAAAVLGDIEAVRAAIAANTEAALAIDDERGWPPLLYACYSRLHQIDIVQEDQLAGVVELLLDAGASPHTNNGAFQHGYRSALLGAVEVNNPRVAEALLDAGANPDDGRCIGQAADRGDHRCLELLLSRGARIAGTWALGAAVYADDSEAVLLLVEALRSSKEDAVAEATSGLADAGAANASHEVIDVLLAAGADPNVRDSDAGLSIVRCAVRAGNERAVASLLRKGAKDDSTEVDRFIGACRSADRAVVRELLAEHPDLPHRLTADDRSSVVDAAGTASSAVIELMLESGFSVDDRNGFGEQPLHNAAYHGNTPVVRLLLEAGADVDGRDDRFESTPLAFMTVGSGEQGDKPSDWIETARLLIEAGASRDGVWILDKPPSEEVEELLLRYGITPSESGEQRRAEDEGEAPSSVGSGVMAEIAQHLEVAYRNRDLVLLGSLLHPEARWTGLCQDRAQVLEWYRGLLAQGVTSAVQSVETDRDAVVLELAVGRPAEGARAAPPQHVYQVFTVVDAQIVEIRAYPDRRAALERA